MFWPKPEKPQATLHFALARAKTKMANKSRLCLICWAEFALSFKFAFALRVFGDHSPYYKYRLNI